MKNSKKQLKKSNPLSVNTFPYRKLYYLTHPWKILKDIYWNVKNFWHRGRFGYAYVDVWNFCNWYPRVGAEALRYLARHNSSYPGTKPWSTIEEWREYLEYLANRLQRCADSQDILFGQERNEYQEELDNIMRETRKITHNADGSITESHPLSKEQEEIRKKYWEREKEIRNADQAYIEETYKWVAEDLPYFWD